MQSEDYWAECIEIAFQDAGITATQDQIATVAGAVEGAHENYGLAHGHDCIPNPLHEENERLRRDLKREKDKVACPECRGRGDLTSRGPIHSATSQCWKCRGEGRISL